jgi:SET domain-containing protein
MKIVEGLAVHGQPGKYGDIYHDDAGLGIYALKNYKKDDVITTVTGPRIKDTDRRLTSRAIQVGKHLFVEPKRFSSFWYLNHSCTPNAYVNMEQLIARKNIKKGTEITVDYSLFTDFKSWEMDCKCGAQTCRKLILPYSRLKTKPKRFISAYLA